MKALSRFREGGISALSRSVLEYTQSRYEDWRDGELDRKYGLRTEGFHADLEELGARGEHARDSTSYVGVQIPIFRAMMRSAGVDPRRHLFVDFGCGKGRALFLAAEQGFRRVLGVEFVPSLHRVARMNVDAFRRQRPSAPPIEVHFGDAATYPIPPEDAMLFFYNPFGERVMRKVAANIQASIRARPRSLVIAYRNPVHCQIFDELAGLRIVSRSREFAIYR